MADVSSHKAIWQMLDRVRGTMPPGEFSVALAALIFLRWADFEEAEREAIAAFDDVDYEPVLPAGVHWRSWCNWDPHEIEEVLCQLPHSLSRFANRRHDVMATALHRIAPALERLSRLDVHALADMIAWLADQPFETPSDRRALRDVLDYVLQKSNDRSAGQYFTPIHIAAFMVEMAKPQFGESVYDPCFGYAGLLTAALDVVEHRKNVTLREASHAPAQQPLQLAGVEINSDAYVIGMTRLVLSGISDPQLEFGNSLERSPISDPQSKGFDVVLTNPPWGMKVNPHDLDHYPVPTSDSSSLFLQHAISQLRPGGRAVIVIPPGLLFRGGREKRLREWLLHENTVEAIVSIPRRAFAPHTSIDTCLLMVRRGGPTESVRMVNTDSIFEKAEKSQIGSAPFVMAAQLSEHVRSTEPGHEWWNVNVSELAEVDYDLTPTRRDRSDLESILESLPKEAEVRLLEDCCTVMAGRSIRSNDLTQSPPKSNHEPSGETLFDDIERDNIDPQRPFDFADTPIPYIRIRDVEKGEASRGSSWLMPAAASKIKSKWKLRSGDILFSKSGTVGKAGIVRNSAVNAIAASGFFVLRVKDRTVDPHYLLAYLQCTEARAWLEDRARGAAAKHLSSAVIKDLPIALPPLQIQQRTANQHRKFGVDALTSLAELLSEGDSQSLASRINDWVLHHLRTMEGSDGDLASDLVLDELEGIANHGCPVNICEECKQPYHLDWDTPHLDSSENYSIGIHTHCLACWLGTGPGTETIESLSEQSPLVPWALAFSEAMQPLVGWSTIPDSLALITVLQSVEAKLAASMVDIVGHLPNQERARQLTTRVMNRLHSIGKDVVTDAKITANVSKATKTIDGHLRIELAVESAGRGPLRDVQFTLKPHLTSARPPRVSFFAPGDVVCLEYEGRDQSDSDNPSEAAAWKSPEWTLNWTARNLSGTSIEGKCEFGIVFHHDQGGSDVEERAAESLQSSPYVCGDPVKRDRNDVFFGRDELLGQIKRQVVESGNVVLLEGNRRAGKSSVLWHIEGAEAIPGWLGVYCSLQGAEGDSVGGIPTADVFRNIAYEIVQAVRKLNGTAILPDGSMLDAGRRLGIARSLRQGISKESPFQDFREYLELCLETLNQQNLGLLLMIDEFDKLQEGIDKGITSPQVPENIRFLVQSYPRFSAILTGSRRLKRMREEYWSALFGLGTRFGVTALPQEAASQLITEPVKGRLSYSNSAVNQAYEMTAGQPYLLQCLCNRVFDIAARSGVRSITIDHVNDAARDLVEDNEHFASLWDYTEFDRRRFLLYLLHRETDGPDPMRLGVIETKLESAGIELREEIIMDDLEYLRELELVDMHGESSGAYYTLTIPMMGHWLETQQDFEILRSRARAEAEDISAKLDEISRLYSEIRRLEDSDESDEMVSEIQRLYDELTVLESSLETDDD